jgi:hypothetical protein
LSQKGFRSELNETPYRRNVETNRRAVLAFNVPSRITYYRIAAPA